MILILNLFGFHQYSVIVKSGNAHSFIKVRGSITVPSTSRKTGLDMAVVDINSNVLYNPVRPAFWEVDGT